MRGIEAPKQIGNHHAGEVGQVTGALGAEMRPLAVREGREVIDSVKVFISFKLRKEEQTEKKEAAAAAAIRSNLLDYDRNTDPGEIDLKKREYMKQNKGSFDDLMRAARKVRTCTPSSVRKMRMIYFPAIQGKTEKGVRAYAQEITDQQPIRKVVYDTEEEDLKRAAGKSQSKATKAEGHRGCRGKSGT